MKKTALFIWLLALCLLCAPFAVAEGPVARSDAFAAYTDGITNTSSDVVDLTVTPTADETYAGVISGKLYHVIARSFHISGRSVDVTSPIQPTLPAGTCDTNVRGVPQ